MRAFFGIISPYDQTPDPQEIHVTVTYISWFSDFAHNILVVLPEPVSVELSCHATALILTDFLQTCHMN